MIKKIKKMILKKVIFRIMNIEEVFQIAYEHGFEKMGHKEDTLPCWDNKKIKEFKDNIKIETTFN